MREVFPDSHAIVRPGLIVGPHDPTGRFTYWPLRLAGAATCSRRATRPAAGADRGRPRSRRLDASARGGRRTSGTFNATGPERALTIGELLETLRRGGRRRGATRLGRRAVPARAGGRPVDGAAALGDRGGTGMLASRRLPGRCGRAALRPLEETVRDTLAWAVRGGRVRPSAGGLVPQREAELLAARLTRTARRDRRRRGPAAQRGSSRRIRSGSTPRRSARSSVSSWKRTMSTTGCDVWTSVVSQPSSRSARPRRRTLGGAALALEHEAAHRLVDRGQVAVQQLLGLVRLGRDERALAQLQRRLLRRRPVAARAGDRGSARGRAAGSRSLERRLDRVGKPRDVLARAAPRSSRPRTCSSRCGTSSSRSPASRRRPRRRARRAGCPASP